MLMLRPGGNRVVWSPWLLQDEARMWIRIIVGKWAMHQVEIKDPSSRE